MAYNDVTEWQQQQYADFRESEEYELDFIVDDIDPIIINGDYAEAYVYINIFWYYNGKIVEDWSDSGEGWFYLQKIGNN